MKVIEFLRTADEIQICKFIHSLLWGCECYGDCPLNVISDLDKDNLLFSCDECDLLRFLNSNLNEDMTKWK